MYGIASGSGGGVPPTGPNNNEPAGPSGTVGTATNPARHPPADLANRPLPPLPGGGAAPRQRLPPPNETLMLIAQHLDGRDVLSLRAATRQTAHALPLANPDVQRGLQMAGALRNEMRNTLALQDPPRPADHLPRQGLRGNINPHGFLSAVMRITHPEQMHCTPPARNNTLGQAEVDALKSFVEMIPHFPSDRQLAGDDQASAVSMSRALFNAYGPQMTNDQKQDLALSICTLLPDRVSSMPHSHSLRQEARSARRRSFRDLDRAIIGAGDMFAIPVALIGTPIAAVRTGVTTAFHMAKDDKTTNKSLKFLTEVINSLPPLGMNNDQLFDRATQLMVNAPDENKYKLEQLNRALKQVGTPVQDARRVNALTNRGHLGLAAM